MNDVNVAWMTCYHSSHKSPGFSAEVLKAISEHLELFWWLFCTYAETPTFLLGRRLTNWKTYVSFSNLLSHLTTRSFTYDLSLPVEYMPWTTCLHHATSCAVTFSCVWSLLSTSFLRILFQVFFGVKSFSRKQFKACTANCKRFL